MLEETSHESAEHIPGTLDEFLEFHKATIRRVAERKYQRQGFTTPDDIEQAISEHVIREWKHYEGANADQARANFNKAANQYLAKESMDYMHFTGSFVYTPALVRSILENSAWSLIRECPDVEGRVDVREAFETLTPIQQSAVFRRYGLKVPSNETTANEQKNCRRGVDNICARLNRRAGKARTYTLDDLRHALGVAG